MVHLRALAAKRAGTPLSSRPGCQLPQLGAHTGLGVLSESAGCGHWQPGWLASSVRASVDYGPSLCVTHKWYWPLYMNGPVQRATGQQQTHTAA
jgi:hypothetical protein